MPTHRLQFLIVPAAVIVVALPAVVRAGDRPIFVVGDWGIGEIDGRIMFYVGAGRYLDTPIPSPPHGPRWDGVYNAFPVAVGAVAVCLYRRRGNPTSQRTRAARRGFEVQEISRSGAGR